MRKLLLLIPAFNEEKVIGNVLKKLPKKISNIDQIQVVVVDDGSTDKTASIAKKHNAIVLRHAINRGLGAALATGFVYAQNNNFDYLITYDSDGQHSPGDIQALVKILINKKKDVVIGSRLLNYSAMPITRRVINFMSNFATWLLFSIWTSDSQSGLRAFGRYAIEKIKLKSQRMEVSSEIFKEISRLKLNFTEVPIQTIYTKYSLQKGQRIFNASNVFYKLLMQRFS